MSEPAFLRIAAALMSGATGFALLEKLRTDFPSAKRDDVYRAIAFAWTEQQSGWLLDKMLLEAAATKSPLLTEVLDKLSQP